MNESLHRHAASEIVYRSDCQLQNQHDHHQQQINKSSCQWMVSDNAKSSSCTTITLKQVDLSAESPCMREDGDNEDEDEDGDEEGKGEDTHEEEKAQEDSDNVSKWYLSIFFGPNDFREFYRGKNTNIIINDIKFT